jgi:hypothetical protein
MLKTEINRPWVNHRPAEIPLKELRAICLPVEEMEAGLSGLEFIDKEETEMPEKNGTGPTGKGPMTGRGSGRCIISLNTAEEELNFLKNQEKVLREQLKHIERRLRIIETANTLSAFPKSG